MRTPPRASPQSHRTVLTGFIRRRACKRDVLDILDENAFLLCKKEQPADLLSHDEIARLTSSPRLARCRCPTCTASASFKYSDHVESYRIRPIKPSLSNQLDQFEFTNSCEERTSQLLAVTCIPTHRATRTTMRWPERHLAGGLLDGEPASGGYKHQSITMKTCRQVQHRPSPPDIGAVIDMAEPARCIARTPSFSLAPTTKATAAMAATNDAIASRERVSNRLVILDPFRNRGTRADPSGLQGVVTRNQKHTRRLNTTHSVEKNRNIECRSSLDRIPTMQRFVTAKIVQFAIELAS